MALRKRRHRHIALQDAAEGARQMMRAPEAPAHIQREQASALLLSAIDVALTDLQRTALLAELSGMPLSEIAQRMGKKRGTLYKLLHDARKRLLAHLQERGLDADALLTEPERAP